tara:strand:- start:371 stop:1807 length:1437 start_codon:yes stop_codon:yes gene_type:complete
MSEYPIIPIILCGGTGTRLWPISRESYPKQYLKLNSNENLTLLQRTVKRISNIHGLKDPILVCNDEHRFIAAEQMRQIGVKPQSILLEPFGKNTAPAITLAALTAISKEKDPILLVLSSDHYIEDEAKFINVIKKGLDYAKHNKLITFGVLPTKPETGYGYIKAENPFEKDIVEGIKIDKFIEKPDLDTARTFLDDKKYLWNSGIFAFKADIFINEVKKYSSKIFEICNSSLLNSENDLDFKRINKSYFSKCPNISIDVAIMEKTNLGTVLNLNAGWSDIGNWQSLWEISKKDTKGNSCDGKTYLKNVKNCILKSEDRLIVGVDLNDLVIVETRDAILVANKSSSQLIKQIVEDLSNLNFAEGITNKKSYRPWGNYVSLVESDLWQVKRLEIKIGESISLQKHKYRSEHWVVVDGIADVEIDNNKSTLNINESIFVPKGAKHRLSNKGDRNLVIIEIQIGDYLGEDDIIRYQDRYGRN